jgi:DNA-directed RNA polymerase specialized sigma24 family protein
MDPEIASFEAFFAAEWAHLLKALILLTGSKAEAEDIAQGAFLRLLERWEVLDHGSAFTTGVYPRHDRFLYSFNEDYRVRMGREPLG